MTAIIRLLRPKQWLKNGFVFAPLIFSGSIQDPQAVLSALAATAIFCFAASTVYVLNDLHDAPSDKLHPTKRISRPLASGTVSKRSAHGLLLSLCCLVALGCAAMPRIAPAVLSYLALNLAYTFSLKHQPVIDIFTIAVGFVLRVYVGAVAIQVPLSSWMFITTLCLALYLASVKRRQELRSAGPNSRSVLKKYSVSLIDRYAAMSATGALLFYSIFVVTTKPELVVTIPLVLFGFFRYWYLVEIHEEGESPSDVLIFDWPLLGTIILWAAVCCWALWN